MTTTWIVRDVMTPDPVCCTPEMNLQEVARLMVEHDCGAIPVVKTVEGKEPVGIITDRDIVCRTVAENMDPTRMRVADAMTEILLTTTTNTTVDECCALMEGNKVRRIPIVDEHGHLIGIVAQADIALNARAPRTAEMVRSMSVPTDRASTLRV